MTMESTELEHVFQCINDSLKVIELLADSWTAFKIDAKNLIIIHKQSNEIKDNLCWCVSLKSDDKETQCSLPNKNVPDADARCVDVAASETEIMIKSEEVDDKLALHENQDMKVEVDKGVDEELLMNVLPKNMKRGSGLGRGGRRVKKGVPSSKRGVTDRRSKVSHLGYDNDPAVGKIEHVDFDMTSIDDQQTTDLEMEFFEKFENLDEVRRMNKRNVVMDSCSAKQIYLRVFSPAFSVSLSHSTKVACYPWSQFGVLVGQGASRLASRLMALPSRSV